jgi:cytochrome c oxidase subunit 2
MLRPLLLSVLLAACSSSAPEGRADAPTLADFDGDRVAYGARLFEREGCATCHRVVEGDAGMVGPSLWGLAHGTRTLADGRQAVVDDAYLRRALLEPTAEVAWGYPTSMPAYGHLSEGELDALVAYQASLGAGLPE